jgi:hypothetical protein
MILCEDGNMDKIENSPVSGGKFEFPIIQPDAGCGCGSVIKPKQNAVPDLNQDFVTGALLTSVGPIPRVSSALRRQDHWGTFKARWGVGRMDYSINPGLYALGEPDAQSPVLVTANYKMSFDYLRAELSGRNAWILVLDTKGINVWCAAGKGTFGTDELVARIESSDLKNIVSHRRVIIPQLGAPGVSAHQVKKLSGFKVSFGPIRAIDLPAYLDAGLKATSDMRRVTFTLKERAELIPIELVAAVKPFFLIAIALIGFAGVAGPGEFPANILNYGLFAALAVLCAIVGGAIINPLLLPYLPGRAFSVKGFSIGLVITLGLLYLRGINWQIWPGRIEAAAWFLIVPAISAYLAMNFTGASTYTSLSGVKREMRWALPLEIAAGVSGLLIWFAAILIA